MPPLGDLVLGSLLAIAAGDEVEQERARAPEGRDWSDAGSSGGYRRDATPRCTANQAPVAIDGLIAAGYGVGSLAIAVAGDEDEVAAGVGAMAVIAAASAVYGWRERERCREAFAAHDRLLEFESLMRQPMGAPGAEPSTP